MFDDIEKVIKSVHSAVVTGSGTVTDEVDLELPRGFVAKIHKVRLVVNVAAGLVINAQAALVNDPDDITTIAIPENQVDHDGIYDLFFQANASHTGSVEEQIHQPPPGKDIIAARNLRFNAANSGAGAFNVICEVFYTLEQVTSDLLMNLLDIL